jgi:hypothetical protein
VEPLVSGLARLGLAAVSAMGLVAAAIMASVAAAEGRATLRRVAHTIGLASAGLLLVLAGRPAAQPFIAFAVVAALAGPQPVALALAAGAAMLAGLAPLSVPGSVALVLAGVAAAIAAHVLGRSASAHVSAGRDAAWPSSAAGATAFTVVLAMDGGSALRGDSGVVGLVLGLTLIASLAATVLLAGEALAVAQARPASSLARRGGRGGLLLAAGLSLVAAALVILRGSERSTVVSWTRIAHPAVLVAMAGLLAAAVPPLRVEPVHGDLVEEEQAAIVLSRLVVVLALLATLAAGIEGWLRAGTYASPLARRLLAAGLVGFAASETPRWRGAARALALGALLLVLLG